jgi:two-component system, OmpR family, response regulator MtrA
VRKFTILVVDDDYPLVELLEDALQGNGFDVITAHTSDEARDQFKEHPDLVVLDVNLGEASGFDLIEVLQAEHDVPVIMLTARTSEEDAVHALLRGADDYMRKPFHIEELLARIEARLRRAPIPAETP